MNIFVLNTGRCGSTTFIKACQHIRNYTALHESRANRIAEQRLAYPRDHIEADNRLSWFLGRLDRQKFGNIAPDHVPTFEVVFLHPVVVDELGHVVADGIRTDNHNAFSFQSFLIVLDVLCCSSHATKIN